MPKKLIVPFIITLLLGALTLVSAVPSDNTEAEKVDKSMCLACHGSFDSIATATADYTAPSGETGTPHRYIPHADEKGIPECVECHEAHPIPPESPDQIVRPEKIDYCYMGCHHANNLQPCSTCH